MITIINTHFNEVDLLSFDHTECLLYPSNKLLNMQSVVKINKLMHQYVCPVPDTVVVGEGGLIL